MRNEQLKWITGLVSLFAVGITFYIFSGKAGLFSLTESTALLIGVVASAYTAAMSMFLSRRLDRRRTLGKRVFIIYSHRDRDRVREIVDHLRERGFNPWLDEEEIIAGQNWLKTIDQAIEDSAVALYLASRNTEDRENSVVRREMKIAREVLRVNNDSQSPVIPVLLEDIDLPKALADVHPVRLYDDVGFEQLDRGLRFVLGLDAYRT